MLQMICRFSLFFMTLFCCQISFATSLLRAGEVFSPKFSESQLSRPEASKRSGGRLLFNQIYYLQPHNTYSHGSDINQWLELGYRSLEIDVLDTEGWQSEGRGPEVGHNNVGDEKTNCSSNTRTMLADCLNKIKNWTDKHKLSLTEPVILFIDLKDTGTSSFNWTKETIADLENYLRDYYGDKMYSYTDLMKYVGITDRKQMRSSVKKTGWPSVDSLKNKYIIAITGAKNAEMSNVAVTGSGAVFFCPDVTANAPDQVGTGSPDNISVEDAQRFVCSNIKAGDHYETTLEESANWNQIIHRWSNSGDFNENSEGEFYLDIAHGASETGFEPLTTLSSDVQEADIPYPAKEYHKVGVRQGLPGYVILDTGDQGGNCLQASGNEEGDDIVLATCDVNNDKQHWLYTAEGQFRPKINPKMCLDVDDAKKGVKAGSKLHLWDCDGGSSEKWDVKIGGALINRDPDWKTFCVENTKVNYCDDSIEQKFNMWAVNSWTVGPDNW